MLNSVRKATLIGGIWFATLVVITAWTAAMGATLSTSALLLAIGAAPGVILLGGGGGPSPTVAHNPPPAKARDGR